MRFSSRDCHLVLEGPLTERRIAQLATPKDAEAIAGILQGALVLALQFGQLAEMEVGAALPVSVDEVDAAAARLVGAFRAWGFPLTGLAVDEGSDSAACQGG